MRIYLKNRPAKIHPDPIWNDGELSFLEDGRPNSKKKNKNKNNTMSRISDQFLIQQESLANAKGITWQPCPCWSETHFNVK